MKPIWATVATPDYFKHVRRLLRSILHHNRDFSDIFTIITPETVEEGLREQMKTIYSNVVFRQIDFGMYREHGKTNPRFWSFSAFRIDAEKVIFIDSDMICNGSVEEIRQAHHSLAMVKERRRPDTFNAGLILIGKEHLGNDTWRELVSSDYSHVNRYGTDQKTYNEHFRGKITELPWEWNKLVTELDADRHRGATFIHYVHKPDNPKTVEWYKNNEDIWQLWSIYDDH